MIDLNALEQAADAFIAAFKITEPPVPVDELLNRPQPGMWERVDLSQLTMSFAIRGDRFAPRVSFAKLVVRQLVQTEWGAQHKLPELIGTNAEAVLAFARMILIPRAILDTIPKARWSPIEVASDFHVPEDDAEARLEMIRSQAG